MIPNAAYVVATKEILMQQRPSPSGRMPGGNDHDPLTPGLPRKVKPIQAIVWVFIAIGVIGLIVTFIFVVFR